MVPTVLAGELGWPAVAEVTSVAGKAGALRVEREVPGGAQVLEISGPAVLAEVIRHIGDVDLVVTGDSSMDVAAKMVPTVLAGELGWPAVAEVTSVTGKAGQLRVEREVPGGAQVLEISGPAVLATSADAAAPRVPGMKDLLAAGKKPVELLELAALKVPPRNAVMTVTGRAVPERKPRKGQLIDTADPAKAAAELVSALRQAGTL